MIHLLGKIYLEYAETKPQINHFVARPDQYVRLIDRGLSNIVDRDTHESNLADFKNMEDAIEKFASLENFITFLTEKTKQDRVMVYCDEISMIKMLSMMWKSVFPNIDLDTAYSFYISYKDAEHFKNEHGREYINIEIDSSKLNRESFLPRYWDLKKEDFAVLYDSAPVLNLSGKEDLMGLEYMFTKLLLGQTSPSFQKKLEYLYKKNLVKEVLMMIGMIKEYALLLLKNKGSAKEAALNGTSVIDFLKSNPRYAALFDNNIHDSAESYNYLKSHYNLLKLISDLYVDCAVIHNKINPSFVSIQELDQEYPICMHIMKEKREPTIEEFMSGDVTSFENYHFFKNFINTGIMNFFLLQSVYIAHQENPSLLNALR